MIVQNVNISTNKSVLGDSQLAKQLIVTNYYCYCPQIKDECPLLLMKLPHRNKNAIKTKKKGCLLSPAVYLVVPILAVED